LEFDDIGFAVGDVIAGSRLRFLNHDLALGRVIWRYINKRDGLASCGFSLLDLKIPLDGPIAWLLSGHIPKNDRPSPPRPALAGVGRATFRQGQMAHHELFPRVRRFSIYSKDSVAR
jgi:hypothetical protein